MPAHQYKHGAMQQMLACVSLICRPQVQRLEAPELNLDFCQKLMSWSAEATQRALKLSAPPQAAGNCRMLFHHMVVVPAAAGTGAVAGGATGGDAAGSAGGAGAGAGTASASATAAAVAAGAHPGCLLEQLARYVLAGQA